MATPPRLQKSLQTPPIMMTLPKSLIPGHGSPGFLVRPASSAASSGSLIHGGRRSAAGTDRACAAPNKVQAVLGTTQEKSIAAKAKAVVIVKPTIGGVLTNIGFTRGLDDITDLLGKSIYLELVSSEVDPKTGKEKEPIGAYARSTSHSSTEVKYEAHFEIPRGFGEVGAILATNEHHREMFFGDIVLTGIATDPVTIECNSWVHAKSDSPEKRIFFANKSYLPSQTPSGLKRLRERELENLRGDGVGERKTFERIYDYDVYNDLGDPDNSEDLKRPVLGGKAHPYPRRCRTGRPRSAKDPESEERSSTVYVPRDEAFAEVKNMSFSVKTVRSVVHALLPSLETALVDSNLGFPLFKDVDSLFDDGFGLPPNPAQAKGIFKQLLPRLIKAIKESGEEILLFHPPAMLSRDKFAWIRDEEFGRQTLAGLNPLSIELVKEFPFVSKLDPKIYGPPESLLTKEIIEREIKGVMTVEEAIKRKKLFILNYHDLLLPYVNDVRELEGTTLYGSRALFFLTLKGTLRPIAIELSRPPSATKPQWKAVFTSGDDNTSRWLWKFAKSHVSSHDAGYHQLVSHWLRTHCCTEPYIIAANRQLSAMHPIYRLLLPHFRYTMEINALARESLINADGIIEKTFWPKKYSVQLSSDVYAQLWRFDMEALPADLIRRGMAVEDPTAEHGLRLTVEDYPYAADGLLVWSAIKQWVTDYVSYYFKDDAAVSSDTELQAFWTEVRTKGHGDKKDEPWWLPMNSIPNLIHIATTIIWVASAHHAAVNFGQYTYGGYFPNRPTVVRTNMPTEDESGEHFKRFWRTPEREILQSFPSQYQATLVMAILDVLSTHSPDEEYLGNVPESAWTETPAIGIAFEKFMAKMKEIEAIIDERNNDINLSNRTGAGVVPYELLKPFSEPGVTSRGIPNSISI